MNTVKTDKTLLPMTRLKTKVKDYTWVELTSTRIVLQKSNDTKHKITIYKEETGNGNVELD